MGEAKTPTTRSKSNPAVASDREISQFVARANRLNPAASGRLIFALDATMSRQPTWDRAMAQQAAMFNAVGDAGGATGRGLSVQLIYFRGAGECRASKWVVNAKALRDLMTGIDCRGGQTQIAKVFARLEREIVRAQGRRPRLYRRRDGGKPRPPVPSCG